MSKTQENHRPNASGRQVVSVIRKLQWTGHIEGMDNKGIPRRLPKGKVEGKPPPPGKQANIGEESVKQGSEDF